MSQLAELVVGLAPDRIKSQQGAIGLALKTLDFGRERVYVPGGTEYHHTVPQVLLDAPKSIPGRGHLMPVPKPPDDTENGEELDSGLE